MSMLEVQLDLNNEESWNEFSLFIHLFIPGSPFEPGRPCGPGIPI
jgi:hypothetical protein